MATIINLNCEEVVDNMGLKQMIRQFSYPVVDPKANKVKIMIISYLDKVRIGCGFLPDKPEQEEK